MKDTPPGRLYAHALNLAKSMTLEELLTRTELPLSWLRKFRQGEIPNPSVQRVERLIVAIEGKELI